VIGVSDARRRSTRLLEELVVKITDLRDQTNPLCEERQPGTHLRIPQVDEDALIPSVGEMGRKRLNLGA